MLENIAAHIGTLIILISIFGGYRMLRSDLKEIINRSESTLTEKISSLTEKIEDTKTSVKDLENKVDSLAKDLSHLKGRLDQLYPPGIDKTAA